MQARNVPTSSHLLHHDNIYNTFEFELGKSDPEYSGEQYTDKISRQNILYLPLSLRNAESASPRSSVFLRITLIKFEISLANSS
jgi:hypothetical protein